MTNKKLIYIQDNSNIFKNQKNCIYANIANKIIKWNYKKKSWGILLSQKIIKSM